MLKTMKYVRITEINKLEVLTMKIRNKIYLVCSIFLLIFSLAGCSSKDIEKTDNLVSAQNMKLVCEETISPNEDYVNNKEDVVKYTIEIYQDENNKILVNAKSNSNFFEPLQYEIEFNTSISKSDVDIQWTTLMGNPTPTANDQLGIAYVSILEKGKNLNEIKISFVNRGIEVIEDTLEKK